MSPIISFDIRGAASPAPSALTWGTENSPHCSAVNALFTLTLKKAEPKSLLGYADSGSTTAATVTPPGCTKSIGTGSEETSLSAASPVLSEYLRGYLNEIPELGSA